MNVKELMIGDLVLCEKKPIKVEIINGLDNCINEVYCQGDIVDEIRETDIEPIPLTPEILKANGFVFDNVEYEYVLEGFPSVIIDVHSACIYWQGHLLRFFSVHELQHALRLCGLTELADNFKV